MHQQQQELAEREKTLNDKVRRFNVSDMYIRIFSRSKPGKNFCFHWESTWRWSWQNLKVKLFLKELTVNKVMVFR